MVTAAEKRIFCDALGIDVDQVKEERVPDPARRAHYLYKVSHPYFGEGIAQLDHDAWHKFMDVANEKPPLPDRCQARTKNGQPCKSGPKKGEIYCGPHLDQINRAKG